jgi:RNA polymerase sigma factor (sigma-70 family)
MDDSEVVAAIAAGDPAGTAMAYDKYAAALYGYCQWMLREPAGSADALRDTFAVAAGTFGDLPDAPKLRPWLYAAARNECQRRLAATSPVHGEQADIAGQATAGADRAIGVNGVPEQDELRALIRAVLAELEPGEREVIELSLRHDLYDTDLAAVLSGSGSQARSLTARARSHLEKNLGPLLITRTGREHCPALKTLLADRDGELTEQTRDLVREHVENCAICASHGRSALRPAALSGLEPLAVLPPGLRDDVLGFCSPARPDAPAARRSAEWARPAGFSAAVRTIRWGTIRRHPGAATAAAAVVLWVVAAVSSTLLVLIGLH